MIFLILKQQNQLNKINSEIKTTFAACLTSMKLKNNLLQHIEELDEIDDCVVDCVVRLECDHYYMYSTSSKVYLTCGSTHL